MQSITCGSQHTCARLDDGSVHCWGSNTFLQLGAVLPTGVTSRVTPEAVAGLRANALAARLYTTCAVRPDASVVCWGANLAGKLGTGASGEASATPTAVAGVTGAASQVDDARGEVTGTTHAKNWVEREASFIVRFDRPVRRVITLPARDGEQAARYVLDFDLGAGRVLHARVALSTVDVDGARYW